MIHGVRRFFADPAHQALGWAALGIAGVGLAAAGLFLMTEKDDSRRLESPSPATTTPVQPASVTQTPTAGLTPGGSPSLTPEVSPSAEAGGTS